MPRSFSGFPTVVGAVEAAELLDPEETANIKKQSFISGAQERISYCCESPAEVARRLESKLDYGLTPEQVAAKLEEFGPNMLQKTEPKSFLRLLVEQINILNMLVLLAGVLCCLQGQEFMRLPNGELFGDEPDYDNANILFAIVGICMFVGGYMEWSCSRVMADVSAMSAPTCKVLRGGQQTSVDASSIVPGDIVLLSLGEVVPADCVVVEVTDLLTNEMPLTGEPHDITKTVRPVDPTSPFPSNMLYAATNVVNGSGVALVVKTGMSTEIGKIAQFLRTEEVGLTSVQRTLNKIGTIITIAMVVLVTCIFCISYFGRINDPADKCPVGKDSCFLLKSCTRALFYAVGAIPETLQPAAMAILVFGCQQMRRINAATSKLAAVDTLGACSFICSDKTGTLTEGKMTCINLFPRLRGSGKSFVFYPTRGFDPRGGIYDAEELTEEVKKNYDAMERSGQSPDIIKNFGDAANASQEAKLVRACMTALHLNSYNTKLVMMQGGHYGIEGNMSEGALVVACAKAGMRDDSMHGKYPRNNDCEVPFSSSRKMMATVHALQAGGMFEALTFGDSFSHVAIIKGAPDVMAPRLTRVLKATDDGRFQLDSKELDGADRAWFQEKNGFMSSQALRVLCFAMTPLTPEDVEKLRACDNSDARFDCLLSRPTVLLGLVGLMDPPRESAKSAIAQCKRAGIRVSMITGDQKPTAIAIAKELGIVSGGITVEGAAAECSVLRGIEDQEDAVDDLCKQVVVWARAQPSDKVTIVKSLQRQRHVVAMTGDGVNDAGALRSADIGVAMGIAGTDVAKGASDMVLLDDRFATIVDAVAEGRRIFANIQKMVTYLLCVNVFEVVVITIAMIVGWAVPLEDTQLFQANFITHEFYPWCLILEAAGFFSMMQPPRDRSKPLIPRMTRHVLMISIFFFYSGLMMLSQYIGSHMYVGTVMMEPMLHATSISAFYDKSNKYGCLSVNTQIEDDDEPGSFTLEEDVMPLICDMEKSRWGSKSKRVMEFAVFNKTDPDDAIHEEHFDTWTGEWGMAFSIHNSFLKDTLLKEDGSIGRFDELAPEWDDPHNFIEKCNDEGNPDRAGDYLCWKKCGEVACWEEACEVKGGCDLDNPDEPAKPTLYKDYNVMAWSCRQMRSVVLLSMVLMEFCMLFGLSKFDFSALEVFSNLSFPLAWIPMLGLLFLYVYLPITTKDLHFAPLDLGGLLVSFAIAFTFYAILEGSKVLHRMWFYQELLEKVTVAEMHSQGMLRAYAGRNEAFRSYPDYPRRAQPLLNNRPEMEMGTRGAGQP